MFMQKSRFILHRSEALWGHRRFPILLSTLNVLNNSTWSILLIHVQPIFNQLNWTLYYYPLLHNKLRPKLIAWNNKHLLLQNFCRLGTWEWLGWWVWLRISHKAAIKVLAGAVVISRLNLGGTDNQVHSCGAVRPVKGPSQVHAYGPHHAAAIQPGSWLPQSKQSMRECGRTPNTEAVVIYNLISEMTAHHFCHILLVTSKSITPAHTQGQEIT